MTPKFAQAVDPIFLHVLDLLERVGRNQKTSPQDERVRIRALIDQAEAILGSGPEWESAKYSLVAWIDEMLVDSPWDGREWWSNNVLEAELFNSRSCFEQFYIRAQEASALTRRDALEVYYVCVVLGFRGLYREPELSESLIQSYNLPRDLPTWAKQASMTIRLGQGRPPLATANRDIVGAPPLKTKSLVVWSWLSAAILLVTSVVVLFWLQS